MLIQTGYACLSPRIFDYSLFFVRGINEGTAEMKRFLLFLIRMYRLLLSPLFPPSCRFTPSCSQYAMDAIHLHGVMRGLYLAIRRILRCHPFHPGGFDPVE